MLCLRFVIPTTILVVSFFLAAFTLPVMAKDVVAASTAEVEAVIIPAYVLDKEKSTLKFIATQNNAPVEGRFTAFDATIAFDPDHVELSSIKVEVDMGSLVLADSQTQATLLTADWFNVAVNPKAVFVSDKVDNVPGTKDYYASGELTLRGVKAPATLNFSIGYMDDTKVVASGYATLERTNFGVGQKEWARDDVVKKSVRVEFRVTAIKKS